MLGKGLNLSTTLNMMCVRNIVEHAGNVVRSWENNTY